MEKELKDIRERTSGIYKHTPENLNQIKSLLESAPYEAVSIFSDMISARNPKRDNIEISIEFSKCST